MIDGLLDGILLITIAIGLCLFFRWAIGKLDTLLNGGRDGN